MHDTAIQMILILHDSGVLCKLHILDHELDHFSCPVLLHDSNVVFTHKISYRQMQRITFMEANRHDWLWIFYSAGIYYLKLGSEKSCLILGFWGFLSGPI